MISHDITVARLLDRHPELLDVLASYHPHFKQLRNRVLRKVMASRVTLAQAARMAGVPAEELVSALRSAVGDTTPEPPAARPAPSPEGAGIREIPRPLSGEDPGDGAPRRGPADATEARRVYLDVREDIRRGGAPFARIMAAVKAIADDDVLVLRTPFEPLPLYEILAKRGFCHSTERHAADDWSVSFARDATSTGETSPASAPTGRRVVLDVRRLEPPQPMVRVLQEIERLGAGDELEVHHDRRPMFLYPQLDERGFVHETDEPEPGLVRILIRRRGA